MVPDTREETGSSTSRPLNVPKAVKVISDIQNFPRKIQIGRLYLSVKKIQDRWRIDDEWWREQSLSRAYYQCLLETSDVVIIFQDLVRNIWYKQSG